MDRSNFLKKLGLGLAATFIKPSSNQTPEIEPANPNWPIGETYKNHGELRRYSMKTYTYSMKTYNIGYSVSTGELVKWAQLLP